jgi:hypothetical protein
MARAEGRFWGQVVRSTTDDPTPSDSAYSAPERAFGGYRG